ncbi:helix-turn-helix domain-containing protein [Rhizobium sp. BK251]|uniref:helix-turn-helix domain-containing protein n=1 Tax=Rhizobium sp. BK251 TaxID=2512125 RepID=UPI001049D706|nr:helix-turn-helix domain-containing protein [Rhizobium sp. BK251]TCL73023.1 excisionase family DNA binding protein [Rhizobium sp. BK251]
MGDILTTAQAARLLGVSVRTAQLWVESGQLPSWKTPGGHRRIPHSAVAALIDNREPHHLIGRATALVLARPGNASGWEALERAGLTVEVVEDPVRAAVRIGETLPDVIVIEDDGDRTRLNLLEELKGDPLLARSLIVLRTEEGLGAASESRALKPHVVFAFAEEIETIVKAILDNMKKRSVQIPPKTLPYPVPANEGERLRAVEASGLLYSPGEESFDRLIELAARVLQAPIAMFTLLTSSEQWFKSKTGFDGDRTPREWAFCNYTLIANQLTVLSNLAEDPRFVTNPTLGQPHNFRFYAGAPVRDERGFALGSICVIDRIPRVLEADDRNALATLADSASNIVRWRAQERELHKLRGAVESA